MEDANKEKLVDGTAVGSALELGLVVSGGLVVGILIGRLEEVDVDKWLCTLSLASILVISTMKCDLLF